jgi:hypothetical protein
MNAGQCQIDLAMFETFTHALLARDRQAHHELSRTLAEGFITPLLAPAEREETAPSPGAVSRRRARGRDLAHGTDYEHDLRERAHALQRFLVH